MGLKTDYVEEVDETTGEVTGYWDGFLLYKLGFDYIEQAFEYVTEVLDGQKNGEKNSNVFYLPAIE